MPFPLQEPLAAAAYHQHATAQSLTDHDAFAQGSPSVHKHMGAGRAVACTLEIWVACALEIMVACTLDI